MSNHSILFPERLAPGTKGGTGFRTNVIEADSGAEVRPTPWGSGQSRVQFEVSKAVSSRADIAEILSMFRAVRGAAAGWRFKDLTDWTTSQQHSTLPGLSTPVDRSFMDPPFTDGVNRVFQLQKVYYDSGNGNVAHIRKITRPIPFNVGVDAFLVIYIAGTPFWVNGLSLLPALHIAVDFDTGRTYWDLDGFGPLPAGLLVEAAFTFHVPARFDRSTDEGLRISWDEADKFSLDGLGVSEIQPDHHCGPEEHLYGGARDIAITSNPHRFDERIALVQRLTGAGPNQVVHMPDMSLWAEEFKGGPYAIIENGSSTQQLVVVGYQGLVPGGIIPANSVGELHWFGAAGNQYWQVL